MHKHEIPQPRAASTKELLDEIPPINNFFENHPECELLQRQINPEDTPDLDDHLKLYEELRQRLLELIRHETR